MQESSPRTAEAGGHGWELGPGGNGGAEHFERPSTGMFFSGGREPKINREASDTWSGCEVVVGRAQRGRTMPGSRG